MKPVILATHIGSILASRRKHLKLSQAQVADRVGLSQNRLSVLESNSETLTARQLIALLNVLGLEMGIQERSSGKSKSE